MVQKEMTIPAEPISAFFSHAPWARAGQRVLVKDDARHLDAPALVACAQGPASLQRVAACGQGVGLQRIHSAPPASDGHELYEWLSALPVSGTNK